MRTLGRRGFSLVETLIAMGVSALLLTVATTALVGTSRLMTWVGVRSDVGCSAIAGLNSLSCEVRRSTWESLTIQSSPTVIAFLPMDPEPNIIGFTPTPYYVVYAYDATHQMLIRRTWSPVAGNAQPLPVTRLTPDQIALALQGTPQVMAHNVTSLSVTPATFPTPTAVTGVQFSMQVSETLNHQQTESQQVVTTVWPRNSP